MLMVVYRSALDGFNNHQISYGLHSTVLCSAATFPMHFHSFYDHNVVSQTMHDNVSELGVHDRKSANTVWDCKIYYVHTVCSERPALATTD